MSRRWNSAVVLVVMFYTTKALYTLHQEPVTFDHALTTCLADHGFLTSMASEEESLQILRSVTTSLKSAGSFSFWVGLWKPTGTCNQEHLPLRGFVWTSTNSSDSGVGQWRKTPVGTCTSERCGLLSLDFYAGHVTEWGWTDSSCTRLHGFICTSKPGGSSPPDVPEVGSSCPDGRTPCGKPRLPSKPPHEPTTRPYPGHPLSRSPENTRIPTTSQATGLTSTNSVISQIRESTVDKYSIFIPVLVALLVLVVLVVVVLVVFKCCFKKKPKKAPHSSNGRKSEVTVDLAGADLDRAETTA